MSAAAMSAPAPTAAAPQAPAARAGRMASVASRLPRWWPLALLTLFAAALRLSTLDLQSFWYDEAFTPVHVLHPSLVATLRSVVHSENTPPLWYVIAWADARILGTGEIALRLPSALAGIATVPVAWAIGAELEGRSSLGATPPAPSARRVGAPSARHLAAPSAARVGAPRAAVACALLVAVNPLFVWYSQEARAYGLFVLTGALALLCFLRVERAPTRARMALFALTGALALLTHYFAVFLLIPMALWLLHEPRTRRAALGALGVLAVVGAALLPLISAQGGHGTQWIGRWPLSERLQAIPQYYLTGYSGKPLGHGIELLVALPILAGLALGLWRMREPRRQRADASVHGLLLVLAIAACGVLIPVLLVACGADYLAPRNLVAAMIPVTAVIALVSVWPRTGRAGVALVLGIAVAFLAISIDVDLSPRLQRGDWRGLAKALTPATAERVISTVELGSAPLEYYLPGLHGLRAGTSVRVREIDETGFAPLRASAAEPPAPGFHLRARLDVHGLIAYRFVSATPQLVSEATLRRHVIALEGPPEVLVPAGVPAS
ncbi:MAG TPA: glycosyltransferase family 39 protein [Solirubrobacteraceae bacterium]|nr:glycosyltransferase family 39 protein [Solirubrobacteraceae bacterium]